ncbi:putative transposase-like protein [Trichonephila clavipes]|nr:putative transposase-like protein [Trichonephila clavipes]
MLGRQIAALSAPTKLRYRTEESSPRSLEPFEPTTHSSSHSKYEKELIAANAECSVCEKAMCLIKKDLSDRYIWECQKKGENVHCIKRSVRKNGWFEENKLSMFEILMLDEYVSEKSNRDFLSFELNISKKTVMDWMSFCTEVCMEMCVKEIYPPLELSR